MDKQYNYSFFLFCQLVKDDVMVAHNLHAPYSELHPILVKHHQIFKGIDNDMDLSEYEAIEMYLEDAQSLLADLMEIDQANTWQLPKRRVKQS